MSRRHGTIAHGDDLDFLFAIEDLDAQWPDLLLASQGGLQPFQHQTLADVFDRLHRVLAGFGDGLILLGWPPLAGICQQQHMGVGAIFRRDSLLLYQF